MPQLLFRKCCSAHNYEAHSDCAQKSLFVQSNCVEGKIKIKSGHLRRTHFYSHLFCLSCTVFSVEVPLFSNKHTFFLSFFVFVFVLEKKRKSVSCLFTHLLEQNKKGREDSKEIKREEGQWLLSHLKQKID